MALGLCGSLLFLSLAHCGTDAPADLRTDADGSTDAAGPDVGAPPPLTGGPTGCTTPDEPLLNPSACLVDALGAYVSPTGNDANDGSKARPYLTLAKALESGRARVLVCEGTYAGSIAVARDVGILSGFDCGFAAKGAAARVVATVPTHALRIASPAANVLVSDLEVEAIDGTASGDNSVAVTVSGVPNARRVRSWPSPRMARRALAAPMARTPRRAPTSLERPAMATRLPKTARAASKAAPAPTVPRRLAAPGGS